MLQFYKPNPKNSGSACSFSYSKKDKAVWVNFVKQATWNDQTKTGTFKSSGPDKKANSKFNITEVAGVVRAIEQNSEFGNFHGNKERNTTFKFCPYLRDGKQVGYSFSLNQNDSQANVKKSFIIGFTFEEGRMLKEYALAAMRNYFDAVIDESNYGGNGQNTKPNEEKVENTAPSTNNNQSGNVGDIPW